MAVNVGEIKILNALFCDQVRREDNGKEILIGVYSGDVMVNSFPARLSLFVWFQHELTRVGNAAFSVRIVDSDGGDVMSAEGETDVEVAPARGSAALPFPVDVEKETSFEFQMKEPEGEWVAISKVRVIDGLQAGAANQGGN